MLCKKKNWKRKISLQKGTSTVPQHWYTTCPGRHSDECWRWLWWCSRVDLAWPSVRIFYITIPSRVQDTIKSYNQDFLYVYNSYSYVVVVINASPNDVSFTSPVLRVKVLQLHPVQVILLEIKYHAWFHLYC